LGGIPNDGRSRHARRDLLEQFQPFAAAGATLRRLFGRLRGDEVGDPGSPCRSKRCIALHQVIGIGDAFVLAQMLEP
jgi:hypothetical protein